MSDHDSLDCMRLLREWVEETSDCLSITVIHQPRREVYEMFHNFLLIEKGQVLAYSTIETVCSFMKQLKEEESEEIKNKNNETFQDPLTSIMDRVHTSLMRLKNIVVKNLV